MSRTRPCSVWPPFTENSTRQESATQAERASGRFTHYYFYLRDKTLGAMALRVASIFPFQTAYHLNGHSCL